MNGKIAGLRRLREGRSPAESRPGTCRLVRPGAACESRTVVSAVTGETSARPVGRESGWYRGRCGLSSPDCGDEGLFCVRRCLGGIVKWS